PTKALFRLEWARTIAAMWLLGGTRRVLLGGWSSDFRRRVAGFLLAAVLLPSQAHATWPPTGVLLANNPSEQFPPIAASDGFGGAFVVWGDLRDLVDHHLYAQRVLYDGQVAPGWPPGGAPVCVAPGGQYTIQVTPDGFGGCFITWVDFRNGDDLYCQR